MNSRPLVVRLRNWVGDVVLSVPALRLLRSSGHELQLVGKPWAAALLAGEGWTVHPRPATLGERVAQLRQLRREASRRDPEFGSRENALVFPTSFSGALEMRLAGLRAVGYSAEARGLLLARSEPPVHGGHNLERYLTLACRFLRTEVTPPAAIDLQTHPQDQAAADALLAAHGVRSGFIVVCPFAGGLFETYEKKWPSFAAFTQHLVRRGHQVVACPGPGEEDIVTSQFAGVKLLSGVGLGTYGGLLRRAALMISNDTGPAHLAAAVGARVLSVLGPTDPTQWAPWGPTVVVQRRWPGWPSIEEVLARAEQLLA